MEAIFAIVFIAFGVYFLILQNEDKKKRQRWAANSVRRREEWRKEKMMGPGYSPDTITGDYISQDQLGDLNKPFEKTND